MTTWPELRQQLAAVPDAGLVGAYSLVRPRRDNGRGWPPASLSRSTIRFTHQPPTAWRFEIDGQVSFLDEALTPPTPEEPQGLRFTTGPYPWRFFGSPLRLVRARHSPALAAAIPIAEPEAVLHGGRPGWSVTLHSSLPTPLRLVVDNATGIILVAECPRTGYHEEITALELRDAIPDSAFRDSDDLAAAERRKAAQYNQLLQHYRSHALPLPHDWPEPIEAPIIADGDIDSGFLVINLGGTRTGPGPSGAWLIRQPRTGPAYEAGPLHNPEVYVHRWHTAHWQWTLGVEGRPLTQEEFDRARDSVNDETGKS